MIYLASPYTDPDSSVRQFRFEQACRAAARLMLAGEVVFSPIAHSHAIENVGMDEKQSGEFWQRQDDPFLVVADKMVVLRLPGWEKSRGVAWEIDLAAQCGIPVEYIDE